MMRGEKSVVVVVVVVVVVSSYHNWLHSGLD